MKNGIEIIDGKKQAHLASGIFPFVFAITRRTERRDDRQQRKKTPVYRGSFCPRATREPRNYKDIKLDELVAPTYLAPHLIESLPPPKIARKKRVRLEFQIRLTSNSLRVTRGHSSPNVLYKTFLYKTGFDGEDEAGNFIGISFEPVVEVTAHITQIYRPKSAFCR